MNTKPVDINCPRCGAYLATSRGETLSCDTFTLEHRARLKCSKCGHITRWGPDKNSGESVDSEPVKV